jgi:plastocyanin
MLSRRTCATALAALLTVSVAACGDPSRVEANRDIATGKPAPSINPTVNPKKSDSPSPAASTTATDAPSASASETSGGGGNTVEATPDNKFTPGQLKVKVGTKVTWNNSAKGFHSVTGGTPTAKDTSKINQPVAAFDSYEVTFDKAGTFPYFCEPHASLGMTGEVVVE